MYVKSVAILPQRNSFLSVSLILADVLFPPFFSVRCMLRLDCRWRRESMTTNPSWRELYRAALLEVEREQ